MDFRILHSSIPEVIVSQLSMFIMTDWLIPHLTNPATQTLQTLGSSNKRLRVLDSNVVAFIPSCHHPSLIYSYT